jgi:hypothetical protein
MKIGLTYGKLMKIGLTYGKLMKIGLTYGKLMKIGSWMIFFGESFMTRKRDIRTGNKGVALW